MKKNKISIIIPTIGRQNLFSLLFRLLKQTKKPDEILIIDNSKDKKAFEIYLNFQKKKKIKYFFLKKQGQYHALNYGIKKANYDNLCFIDDDCLPSKDWLKNLYNCYLKFNKKAVILGRNENFYKKNLFSFVEYYNDQSFFEEYFYKKDKILYSLFLDVKNCFLNKKIILANKLKFNNIIHLDLDLSFRLFKKNIKIIYCYQVLNYHLGRLDFISHLKREFFKGIGNYQIFLKWGKKWEYKQIIFYQKIFKNNFKKTLINKILNKKNYFFKIGFYLLYYFDFFIRFLGFNFSKLSFNFFSQKGR